MYNTSILVCYRSLFKASVVWFLLCLLKSERICLVLTGGHADEAHLAARAGQMDSYPPTCEYVKQNPHLGGTLTSAAQQRFPGSRTELEPWEHLGKASWSCWCHVQLYCL